MYPTTLIAMIQMHPSIRGATEIPDDEIDQDCDSYDLKTWYRDIDNDGYGNGAVQTYVQLYTCRLCIQQHGLQR